MLTIGTRRALLGGGRRATPWWYVAGQTCVAAYQPIGAPSLAASYVNLANPGTYDAAEHIARPGFSAEIGWIFTEAAQILDSGIQPGNNQLWSAIIRFTDSVAQSPIGFSGTGESAFGINTNTNGRHYYLNGLAANVSGAVLNGVMCVAGRQGFLDGIIDGGLISANTPNFLYTIALGGRFWNGDRDGGNVKIQAVAIYSTTLSASDVAALTARMQAL